MKNREDAASAEQKVALLVQNQQERPVTFVLEPYGLAYPMAPGPEEPE